MDGYQAFVLDEISRQDLLRRFPPRYGRVIAHHITHRFPADASDELPAERPDIVIVGHHDDGRAQVAVAEVGGRKTQASRQDGRLCYYHVTVAVDAGVEPREANDVLAAVVEKGGEDALCNLPQPFAVKAKAQYLTRE